MSKFLTLGEFIELLKAFSESDRGSMEMPVAYTFETVVSPITREDIYISADGVLMIGGDDGEQYDFKTGAMSARKQGGLL